MDKKILYIIIIVLSLILVVQITTRCDGKRPDEVTTHDTIFLTDSIFFPKLDSIEVTKYKTIYVPTPPDTITKDSIVVDSIWVDIPISKYQIDTTFTNQANLKAELEGFSIQMNKVSVTYPKVDITTEKRCKNKRWGLGVQVGYGVGVNNNQIYTTPYIGLGISYNILNF